jgi:hypothetical protein
MAGISDNLEEFRKLSRKYYQDLIEGLEEKYCWKCPMRTNSSEAFCREVDSWVRLSGAFEMGIYEHLRERGIPNNCLEVMAAKMLEKKMKSDQVSAKFEKLVILKVDEDMDPDVKTGNFILINENRKVVKKGDKILLPRSCPLSSLWFSKISFKNKMPLKIFDVAKVFHKIGVKYIRTEEGLEIPLEYVYGVILKIIHQDDPIFSELHLGKI